MDPRLLVRESTLGGIRMWAGNEQEPDPYLPFTAGASAIYRSYYSSDPYGISDKRPAWRSGLSTYDRDGAGRGATFDPYPPPVPPSAAFLASFESKHSVPSREVSAASFGSELPGNPAEATQLPQPPKQEVPGVRSAVSRPDSELLSASASGDMSRLRREVETAVKRVETAEGMIRDLAVQCAASREDARQARAEVEVDRAQVDVMKTAVFEAERRATGVEAAMRAVTESSSSLNAQFRGLTDSMQVI